MRSLSRQHNSAASKIAWRVFDLASLTLLCVVLALLVNGYHADRAQERIELIKVQSTVMLKRQLRRQWRAQDDRKWRMDLPEIHESDTELSEPIESAIDLLDPIEPVKEDAPVGPDMGELETIEPEPDLIEPDAKSSAHPVPRTATTRGDLSLGL